MKQRIKDNLEELQLCKNEGCLFFTFVNQPEGICLQTKDEDTLKDVFMKHLNLAEAKRIVVADNDGLPGVIVIRPNSPLYELFLQKIGKKLP